MVRASCLMMIAVLSVASAGCVERRFVITTEPYGAMVYDWTDTPIGATPADRSLVWNGTYRFKLVKDGYQTKVVEEPVKGPWFTWFGIDFFTENLVPYNFQDIRRLHYKLDPVEIRSAEEVRNEGELLRQRGQTIGSPAIGSPIPQP